MMTQENIIEAAIIKGSSTPEYNDSVIYYDGKVDMVLFPEGYATVSDTTVTFHYYTQDYLGNNRAVIDGATGAIITEARFFHLLSVVSAQRSDAASSALSSGCSRLKWKPYSSAPSASLPLSVIIPPNGYPK